jgi:purine nucleosidase
MPDSVPARLPIILDVDTGIDDSLALLYACASPEVEIVGVGCTAGNIDARQVAENTRAVLELAGREDVEVAMGRDVPLVRDLVLAPETHGPKGIGYAELPPARMPLSARHSADMIAEEVARRPGEVTLVTLGPLTNAALAVLRHPDLPLHVRRLVIMGGSYRTAGNTAPTSEWNVAVDPEAAQVVFRAFGDPDVQAAREASGLPPRPLVLGLDVPERAKFTLDHLARLAARAGRSAAGSSAPQASSAPPLSPAPRPSPVPPERHADPVLRYLADALRFYMEFHSRYDGFFGAFIHDPLALAVALDPSLVRTEALAVEVELGGTLTAGETVTDWRRTWGRSPNLDVAVEADIATFMDLFIERVGALAAVRAPGAAHAPGAASGAT